MSDHDPHDPWASLAESLGAIPANEPARPAPAPPPPAQSSRPRPPQRPKPPAVQAGGDWEQLAAELGVSGSAETRPAPRPPVEPAPRPMRDRESEPRSDRDRNDDRRRRDDDVGGPASRTPRRRELDEDRLVVGGESSGEPRGDANGPRATDGDGDDADRRGRRRRRGRRGGRGRGRREGDRLERPAEAADMRAGDAGEAARDAGFDREPDAWEIREARRADDDSPAEVASDLRGDSEDRGDRLGDQGDDEGRPRRRRRRGRRGGRGRRRDEGAERSELPAGEGAAREASRSDGEDEPLPTSYGMRPRAPARGDTARGDGPTEGKDGKEGDEAAGEGRGRRRRRRRGGEGRTRGDREGSAGREGGTSRSRSRSGGRRTGESRSSSFSRGRRDDFAPVAGRHDDDDEGLEFLGVEEAGQDPPRRQRAAEDEDILVESGLNTVLDVPSWVEAIGIVIAGNLDARNKSRGGDRNR